MTDEEKKWLLCTLGAIRDNVKLHRLHGKEEFLDSINSLTTEIENYFLCNTAKALYKLSGGVMEAVFHLDHIESRVKALRREQAS